MLFFDYGVVDLARCGLVYMTDGCAVLIPAVAVGDRHGRYNPNGSVNDLHSKVLCCRLLEHSSLGSVCLDLTVS